MNNVFAGKSRREQFATAEVLLIFSLPLIVVLYHTVIDGWSMLMR